MTKGYNKRGQSKTLFTLAHKWTTIRYCLPHRRVPTDKCRLDPTSRPGVDPALNFVPTSMIILGRTHFSSNVGSSLHTWMSVYKYVGIRESSPLPFLDCVPTTLFDTMSLCQDYLHEVVLIQGQAHLFHVPTMKYYVGLI